MKIKKSLLICKKNWKYTSSTSKVFYIAGITEFFIVLR